MKTKAKITRKDLPRNTWRDVYEQVGDSALMLQGGLVQPVPVELMAFLVSQGLYEVFTKSAVNRPTQRAFLRRAGEVTIARAAQHWAAMEKQRCRE